MLSHPRPALRRSRLSTVDACCANAKASHAAAPRRPTALRPTVPPSHRPTAFAQVGVAAVALTVLAPVLGAVSFKSWRLLGVRFLGPPSLPRRRPAAAQRRTACRNACCPWTAHRIAAFARQPTCIYICPPPPTFNSMFTPAHHLHPATFRHHPPAANRSITRRPESISHLPSAWHRRSRGLPAARPPVCSAFRSGCTRQSRRRTDGWAR